MNVPTTRETMKEHLRTILTKLKEKKMTEQSISPGLIEPPAIRELRHQFALALRKSANAFQVLDDLITAYLPVESLSAQDFRAWTQARETIEQSKVIATLLDREILLVQPLLVQPPQTQSTVPQATEAETDAYFTGRYPREEPPPVVAPGKETT